MDPKVFTTLELAFAGVLLVVVLYIGGIFNEGEPPIPPGAIVPPAPQPASPQNTPAPTLPEPTPPPTLTPTLRPATGDTTVTLNYEIAPGDTCSGIAVRFNVSLESLIAANNLDSECRIIAGNTLVVPQPATPVP